MQTVWRGAIAFGLVSIPVRLNAATEEHSLSFHQVHAKDGGRIHYRRVCEKDGSEVPYSEIAKGYEMPDGQIVVLTEEDFKNLPLPSSRNIEVLEFISTEEIDSIYFTRSYYIRPDQAAMKPYVLLRDALKDSKRLALVKITLRNHETLAVIRPEEEVLLLQTMFWPDEIRSADEILPDEEIGIRPQELAMATSYIDALSGDFHPEEYHDEYRQALEELVASKAAGKSKRRHSKPAPQGQVVDLMAALQASVDQASKQNKRKTAARRGA